MSFPFVLLILALIVTAALIVAWFASRKVDRSDREAIYMPGIVIFAFAAVILAPILFWSTFTAVPARSIGVVTYFGKPVDSLDSGPHFKAPWEKTKELDGKIQTTSRTGSDNRPTGSDNKNGDAMSCTDIKIGNGSVACVDNSTRWRIKLDSAKNLYQDYPKGMEDITDSLVKRQVTAALNEVLSEYDPLAQVKDADQKTSVAPDLTAYSEEIKQALDRRVGKDIEVLDVIVPIIRLDKATQGKINAFQSEVAQTRIAQQNEQTAKAQAKANEAITKSVQDKPEVLQKTCLDILAEMVKTKQQVPIGFNCFGNGAGAPALVTPVK